ncbi:helix-turn-helix transcriptional regulator [Dolosigranulum pigrum]|uniref:helix-turn-helix transcriptional regulator n=1 Tax=Dolosigranulum pigrum TaxID=29394 RepID=UPI0015EC4651|nr:transcriptional regulator [Dolosigranulum pigrum]
MDNIKINKVAGYRKMAELRQADMAEYLGISRQSYWCKENNRVSFSDKEKQKIKELFQKFIPELTIDDIFF